MALVRPNAHTKVREGEETRLKCSGQSYLYGCTVGEEGM